jgi:hypothetical protein
MPKDKPSQDGALERERRHINRNEDPNFDPIKNLPGKKIPGADQTPGAKLEPADNSKKAPA